jgi:predicted unusual protein kinase regulating ubiquinone biosynthesis (AarF/ABC1/UbiB family)
MVASVPDLVGENLSITLISITQRDAHRLTKAYKDLGFFLPNADLERITEAVETLLNHIWGRNLLELSNPDPAELQALGQEFRDLLFDFPFQIPQDFIYLGRAIGMVSGLVSQLNPEINPWYHLEKFGEELVKSQGGRQWSKTLVLEILRPFLQIPGQMASVLTNLERGTLKVHTVADRETTQRLNRMDKKIGQLSWSILGAAGIISATLVYLKRNEK